MIVFEAALTEICISDNHAGGRSSQAIVDGAMNALRNLVKERLSGRSGGSDYKQVMNLFFCTCMKSQSFKKTHMS